jgi:hypothetical protein
VMIIALLLEEQPGLLCSKRMLEGTEAREL